MQAALALAQAPDLVLVTMLQKCTAPLNVRIQALPQTYHQVAVQEMYKLAWGDLYLDFRAWNRTSAESVLSGFKEYQTTLISTGRLTLAGFDTGKEVRGSCIPYSTSKNLESNRVLPFPYFGGMGVH